MAAMPAYSCLSTWGGGLPKLGAPKRGAGDSLGGGIADETRVVVVRAEGGQLTRKKFRQMEKYDVKKTANADAVVKISVICGYPCATGRSVHEIVPRRAKGGGRGGGGGRGVDGRLTTSYGGKDDDSTVVFEASAARLACSRLRWGAGCREIHSRREKRGGGGDGSPLEVYGCRGVSLASSLGAIFPSSDHRGGGGGGVSCRVLMQGSIFPLATGSQVPIACGVLEEGRCKGQQLLRSRIGRIWRRWNWETGPSKEGVSRRSVRMESVWRAEHGGVRPGGGDKTQETGCCPGKHYPWGIPCTDLRAGGGQHPGRRRLMLVNEPHSRKEALWRRVVEPHNKKGDSMTTEEDRGGGAGGSLQGTVVQQMEGEGLRRRNVGAIPEALQQLSVPWKAPLKMLPSEPFNSGPSYPAWSRTVEEVLDYHGISDVREGLSEDAVTQRRQVFGLNELEKEQGTPFWKLVLAQFDDALVKVLIAAAVVSFVLAYLDGHETGKMGIGAFTEPLVILLIVALNAVIGVWQESRAESTLQALKDMQPETARVFRKGQEIPDLPARELVPGDVVELRVGDKVPADLRIVKLQSMSVRLEQASLTGESEPVLKGIEKVESTTNRSQSVDDCATDDSEEHDIDIQSKECMAFAGTTVSNGNCLCVVNDTGMNTEIGKIQSQLKQASEVEYDTPLSRKLDEFASGLTKVVGAVCVLVWLMNYKYFVSWEVADSGLLRNFQFNIGQATYYFKVAVALAVAAIPEGLPAVITTCLALGTRRMAQKNAIVRKIPSVETLGCTTVICSDKTGTLTTNQMSVVQFVGVGLEEGELRAFEVMGTTYNPQDGGVAKLPDKLDVNLETIAQVCAVCNDAGVMFKKGSYVATGMPTEAALKVLVEKIGLSDPDVHKKINEARIADPERNALGCCDVWSKLVDRLATLEFDRYRKSMSVLLQKKDSLSSRTSLNQLFVKGAAECVLERCDFVQLQDGRVVPMTESFQTAIASQVNAMTQRALRCLALAVKTNLGSLSTYNGESHPARAELLDPENYPRIESALTFVGLAGLQDPPRKEVKGSIQDCQKAGIRVIVITGDNKNTAEAICRQIGLFDADEDLSYRSFTGTEFMQLPSSERMRILVDKNKSGQHSCCFVFSRAEPKHKQEIVRMLKEAGEVVAMTGDGVNDAPALKLADIGVAMGISGTEVAKEASDMVLVDDNFATIVAAVREGRSIYNNMKSFIRYLISSNIGEVVSIFLTALLGFPQGLVPVQLLWVNLVTDGAPATALGFNPPDKNIMETPPRRPDESLLSRWILFRYLVIGVYVGLATVGIFGLWYVAPGSILGVDLTADGHTPVTIQQLAHWGECSKDLGTGFWSNFAVTPFTAGDRLLDFQGDPCAYFEEGKTKASTLAMSTLVVIEMFNALNALSEDNSLLMTPPWSNPWLLLAIAVSMGLHFAILYTPWLADIFGVVPLSTQEWLLVVAVSAPIVLVDEVLKFVGRNWFSRKSDD